MSFIHHFLLLLHGTGGTEHDLVPLGRELAPGAALLSPRGKVLENGMPRFFRRFAEGKFDEEDVIFRANELADFIASSRETHRLTAPIAVGFSNGANIAAADGANVDHRVLPAGHGLSQADLAIAKDWLAAHTKSLARS